MVISMVGFDGSNRLLTTASFTLGAVVVQTHSGFKINVDKGIKQRHVAALVRSHMNDLKPFQRTIEQTTETMPSSPRTITAAAMTTNRILSL